MRLRIKSAMTIEGDTVGCNNLCLRFKRVMTQLCGLFALPVLVTLGDLSHIKLAHEYTPERDKERGYQGADDEAVHAEDGEAA